MAPKPLKNPKPSPSPSSSPNPKSPKSKKTKHKASSDRDFENEDAIVILNAVIKFKAENGRAAPTVSTMKSLLDSIKGELHREFTIYQLYNKFRTLKVRYRKALDDGVGPTDFDRSFFDLSVKAWGEMPPFSQQKLLSKRYSREVNKKRSKAQAFSDEDDYDASDCDCNDDEDGDDCLTYVSEEAKRICEREGIPTAALELGLKHMGMEKAAALNMRWRKHLESRLKIEEKSFELNRDLYDALVGKLSAANS